MTLWGVVLGVIGGLSGLTEGRPVYGLMAAGELMGMVADQLSQYPEGQALVRDVLGLPDPTTVPPPTTTKRTFQDPPRDSGSDVVIPEPSISSSNHGEGRRPSSVSVTPTQGRLSLHPVGIVYRRSQMGFIRIRVDISSLHRQIQEVQHHFQESGYPSAQETSDGNSCIDSEGSFVSLHQALLAGAGAPVIGEFNSTHQAAHVQGTDLQENCTLEVDHLALLSGKVHYAHDFAMQLLLRQSTRCLDSVDQNLLRFTVGSRWGNTVATRDILQMLGVGGLSLGLINRLHLDRLQGQMNQVSHQVEALVGEQHLLSKITGALIDSQARMHKALTTQQARLILTDSLAKMNTMVSTSCHIAGNLRNLLADLREHRFPGEFFEKGQLDEFFEEFTQHVDKVGLAPIFPSSASLWNSKVQSMIKEEDVKLPIPAEDEKTDAEQEAEGVHMWFEKESDEEDALEVAQVKVVLPKSTQESTKAIHEHEDHELEGTLFSQHRKGMVLYMLVPVPLKRRSEDGYSLYKVAPTLLTLSPEEMTPSPEESEMVQRVPVPIRPDMKGGLLVPRMQSSKVELVEVSREFLDECQVVEDVVHVCPDPRPKPGAHCLKEVFNNEAHAQDCLGDYDILNPAYPHMYDLGQGQVQVYIPDRQQLYTECPGQARHKIWKMTAGLYKVNLPLDCTLKVGTLRYSGLEAYEVLGALNFVADLGELRQLQKIQKVVEEDNWQELRDLLQEQKADETNLRDLHRRLEENLVERFTRKNPTALTYYSLAAAVIIVLLIIMFGIGAFRYIKTLREKANIDESRIAARQELSQVKRGDALEPVYNRVRPTGPTAEEVSVPFLTFRGQQPEMQAIEYVGPATYTGTTT